MRNLRKTYIFGLFKIHELYIYVHFHWLNITYSQFKYLNLCLHANHNPAPGGNEQRRVCLIGIFCRRSNAFTTSLGRLLQQFRRTVRTR